MHQQCKAQRSKKRKQGFQKANQRQKTAKRSYRPNAFPELEDLGRYKNQNPFLNHSQLPTTSNTVGVKWWVVDKYHTQFSRNINPKDLVLYIHEHETAKYVRFVKYHLTKNGERKR